MSNISKLIKFLRKSNIVILQFLNSNVIIFIQFDILLKQYKYEQLIKFKVTKFINVLIHNKSEIFV